MVIADDAGDLPRSVFPLPKVNELAFADTLGILMPRMMEAMHACFEQSISFHVINLQRSGDELAGHLSADVLPDGVSQRRFAQRHSALIVIELHVVDEERFELVQVALVVGVEERCIQCCACAIQVRAGSGSCRDRAQLALGWPALGQFEPNKTESIERR